MHFSSVKCHQDWFYPFSDVQNGFLSIYYILDNIIYSTFCYNGVKLSLQLEYSRSLAIWAAVKVFLEFSRGTPNFISIIYVF